MKEAIIQYNDMPSGGHMAVSWIPLVRCEDCKHGKSRKNAKGEDMIDCLLADNWLKHSDWFCADGEREG